MHAQTRRNAMRQGKLARGGRRVKAAAAFPPIVLGQGSQDAISTLSSIHTSIGREARNAETTASTSMAWRGETHQRHHLASAVHGYTKIVPSAIHHRVQRRMRGHSQAGEALRVCATHQPTFFRRSSTPGVRPSYDNINPLDRV